MASVVSRLEQRGRGSCGHASYGLGGRSLWLQAVASERWWTKEWSKIGRTGTVTVRQCRGQGKRAP